VEINEDVLERAEIVPQHLIGDLNVEPIMGDTWKELFFYHNGYWVADEEEEKRPKCYEVTTREDDYHMFHYNLGRDLKRHMLKTEFWRWGF
jgi:hypothetical protein